MDTRLGERSSCRGSIIASARSDAAGAGWRRARYSRRLQDYFPPGTSM